jgi:hypothetical protein
MTKVMIIKNVVKPLILKIQGKNLGKGNYTLTIRDLFLKVLSCKSNFSISCVIYGFPRTGTHWVRNVVDKSSEEYCPSLAEIKFDTIIKNQIFPIFKIHARSKFIAKMKMFFLIPLHKFCDKFIYVYRDPRDAIISLYNMYNNRHGGNCKQEHFLKSYDPINQSKWELNSWVLNKKTRNNENILIVRF